MSALTVTMKLPLLRSSSSSLISLRSLSSASNNGALLPSLCLHRRQILPSLPSSSRSFSSTRRRSIMSLSSFTPEQLEVREAVSKVCARFPDSYWAACDAESRFPSELHAALAADGWIGIALPEALGGAGLGIAEATVMMQAIAESGAGMQGAQSLHANVYATQPIARFATPEQRDAMLRPLIRGDFRTCFAVTEPDAGLDTLRLRTTATRLDPADPEGGYAVSGRKIWITGAQGARRVVLLARTTPLDEVTRPQDGLSLFFAELDRDAAAAAAAGGLELREIRKMGARGVDANEVLFDDYRVPAAARIGAEGEGWRIVLHGMNAERCLLAGEALGLGYAALAKAAAYARDRVVFGRPVGGNQGLQHPLAAAYMQLEAAKLATYHAARLYDLSGTTTTTTADDGKGGVAVTRQEVGIACNTAKYLAAEAAFTACERSVLAMGGMGYAAEFHVERYMRECFIPRIAPVSGEMIKNFVAEKALGLPRSY